jgi:hypothetical protein
MRAMEINSYLKSLVGDLPENTVDRVIYGDTDREVSGISVCWMPYIDTIKEAKRLGTNVMVVHEPTFYTHWDLQGKTDYSDEISVKKKIIDENQITIIRCHDVWDTMPQVGIPFGWGRFLRLGEPLCINKYLHIYKIAPQKAIEFAKGIVKMTSVLGQDAIGFYGDPNRTVTKVGIGTGCCGKPWDFYKMGADIAIVVDDIMRAWEAGEWCNDTGFPAVVVNHAVSEVPAMSSLADTLIKRYPELKVMHIPQKCSYLTVLNTGCIGGNRDI